MNMRYFFEPFPIFDLGEIILREIPQDDAAAYFDYMNMDKMSGFLTKENIPENIEASVEEVEYWASLFPTKKSIYWAIALKENNLMIGTAGFNHISFKNSKAEISYDLHPNYWGRGIMLKSIKSILQFSDTCFELVRVQATVVTYNEKSIKLLERCGFNKGGYLTKYEVVDGEHKDYYMFERVH